MGRSAGKLFAALVVVAEIVSIGATGMASASAQESSRAQIKRQQQIILRQQREILDNQRRIEGQREHIVSSPVTGEPIDERRLPKGLLSGILPACPLGFAYNPFTGCVLYVAH